MIGALKVVEGFLSGNPAEMASGVAYMAAGCAGMVKAGAETAMMCGADHDTCQAIIDVASKIQVGCEVVAMALDVFRLVVLLWRREAYLAQLKKCLAPV